MFAKLHSYLFTTYLLLGDVWRHSERQRIELSVCSRHHNVSALVGWNGLRLLFCILHPFAKRGESVRTRLVCNTARGLHAELLHLSCVGTTATIFCVYIGFSFMLKWPCWYLLQWKNHDFEYFYLEMFVQLLNLSIAFKWIQICFSCLRPISTWKLSSCLVIGSLVPCDNTFFVLFLCNFGESCSTNLVLFHYLFFAAVLFNMKNKYKDYILLIYCFLFPTSGIETWCLMVSQEFEWSRLQSCAGNDSLAHLQTSQEVYLISGKDLSESFLYLEIKLHMYCVFKEKHFQHGSELILEQVANRICIFQYSNSTG